MTHAIASALLLILLGADPEPPQFNPFDLLPARPATLVHVFDGDTICVDIHDSIVIRAGRTYHRTRTEDVRIRGYDAPERWEDRGPEATAALTSLLASGTTWIKPTGRTSFHRIEANVFVRVDGSKQGSTLTIDVAGAMRRLGHTKPED